ncbi:baseplate protein [Mannheimia granulomatis]|uniref:Phage baseplate protein n=1 Tax=Mannheimia granulomatis TaxID=85402 RepID=A0A011P705_9PAST|nr:GPW/gp25 family protein [Mannheimia granulomatis]EXI62234.1 phage baseplate protein [Mannheimia granulomatis]QIM66324.1 phage baseplate protein [Mannheimia granulomatis]RGE47352.1 baseplate protein [Mannheimia granulomatis]
MNINTPQYTHWQIAPDGVKTIQGEDDLHQCIINILSTRKGTDVLRPDFGSDHFEYIDQPFDIAVPNMVREIFVAIDKWEKRVIVQEVQISGTAPHFFFNVKWCVADDVAKQIYSTEFNYGNQ